MDARRTPRSPKRARVRLEVKKTPRSPKPTKAKRTPRSRKRPRVRLEARRTPRSPKRPRVHLEARKTPRRVQNRSVIHHKATCARCRRSRGSWKRGILILQMIGEHLIAEHKYPACNQICGWHAKQSLCTYLNSIAWNRKLVSPTYWAPKELTTPVANCIKKW